MATRKPPTRRLRPPIHWFGGKGGMTAKLLRLCTILVPVTVLALSGCERRNSKLTHASEELDRTAADGEKLPDNYAVDNPTGRPLAQGDPAPMPDSGSRPTPAPAPTASSAPNVATGPATAAPAATPAPVPTNSPNDDPTISRSAGTRGGVVVLWPRITPRAAEARDRQAAQRVQSYLRAAVQRHLPGRAIDIRPEPERACRRSGCDAVAVGAVLAKRGSACMVVATVTPPGPVETTLVPMAGQVDLQRASIPFRDPPENYLSVRDFADCSNIEAQLARGDAALAEALRRAAP